MYIYYPHSQNLFWRFFRGLR